MIESRPSDMFSTGDVLNNTYEVEGVLGRGGTGEVYRVVNKVTGRIFAVKALSAQFSGNEDYVELMKREEEMRNIIHDSVVRYNECSRTDSGNVILVMDYIAGQSLADAMAKRQVSEKELLIIAHRISEGLVAAHGHGIVHRDLSPDNIILRDGEAAKATLIDFGIAKDTTEGARTIVGNDFAGKYEYAAPEQIEGKAEAKSDLYALGATLLAAYRGETPFLGTTPGEIVRRKQGRLDTEGVPDRLRGLIDKLSDPDPAMRPESAVAAVQLIDSLLEERPRGAGKTVKARGSRRAGSRLMPLALVGLVVAALGLGGYFLRDTLFGPSLPFVSPYTLSASKGIAGRTMMTGHAPDEESATTLVSAFVGATGALSDAATVTQAEGVPGPAWIGDVTGLLAIATELQRWQLDVSDGRARLSGLAPDNDRLAAIRAALQTWQAGSSLSLDQDFQAGPEILSASSLSGALDDLRTCGPLSVDGDQFAIGETVTLKGYVATPSDETGIAQGLQGLVGSREVVTDFSVLNPDLCAIREVLPATQLGAMSIWFGEGPSLDVNLTGVFKIGENPVVDIFVPADQEDAFLWVIAVENTGNVINILPNINDTEQRIGALGEIEGGVRRVRVLHPRGTRNKAVSNLKEGDDGKSEIVAFLSKKPLFDIRRPHDESTTSAKEALTEALQSSENDLISIATRIIDVRR